MEPQPKLDAWQRKSALNNPRQRNGAKNVTIVGSITPVWFSYYRENTENFQSLYLGFKWSLIHDILSHYYDTLVTGILVEIHKFKKELSHLVAKKVYRLWFCTRPYWYSALGLLKPTFDKKDKYSKSTIPIPKSYFLHTHVCRVYISPCST